MRAVLHITFFCGLLLFSGCESSGRYRKLAGSIDSLSAAVAGLDDQLKAADTGKVSALMMQSRSYSTFIQQHFTDTLGRNEAENLRQFDACTKQLFAFRENRKQLVARSGLLKEQLWKLANDARLEEVDVERLRGFYTQEKAAAAEFSGLAQDELSRLREALARLRPLLPKVADMVRERNNGLPPLVVTDTSTD